MTMCGKLSRALQTKMKEGEAKVDVTVEMTEEEGGWDDQHDRGSSEKSFSAKHCGIMSIEQCRWQFIQTIQGICGSTGT